MSMTGSKKYSPVDTKDQSSSPTRGWEEVGGAGVMKDEEVKVEEIETSHTESHVMWSTEMLHYCHTHLNTSVSRT